MSDNSDGWIVSTGAHQKLDQATRTRVRRHVMKGQNTRASRRAKAAEHDQNAAHEWMLTTPRKVASDISLFGFEHELPSYQAELIHKAFTVVKPATPTFQGMPIDQPVDNMFCFGNFSHDPALFNSILYTAQVFRDAVVDGLSAPSSIAGHHLALTLHHLQERLNGASQGRQHKVTDATLSAMTTLAMASIYMGDLQAAEWHLAGLRQLVEGRGGMETLKQGTMLEIKARRVDFALALASGRSLQFVPAPTAGPTAGPTATLVTTAIPPELTHIEPRVNPTILHLWTETRKFSLLANQATTSQSRLPATLTSQLVTDLATPLLAYPDAGPATSISELLRLTLLAVLKCVLTPFSGYAKLLTYMTSRLRDNLLVLHNDVTNGKKELSQFLVWAGFVVAISIFEEEDERQWIGAITRLSARDLEVGSWESVKAILGRFIWVDATFDHQGQKLYEAWLGPS